MRRASSAAIVGILSIASFASNAKGGGWDRGGSCCSGHYSAGSVYFVAPPYSYAPPTTTAYPHYAIQPSYIVPQTYVLPEHINVGSISAYSLANGFVVNQGQYYTDAARTPLGGYDYSDGYGYSGGYGYRQYRYGVR